MEFSRPVGTKYSQGLVYGSMGPYQTDDSYPTDTGNIPQFLCRPFPRNFGNPGNTSRPYSQDMYNPMQCMDRPNSIQESNVMTNPKNIPYNEGTNSKKFSQKIYVDGLFPPHIRPASVLIGTKGMNHHKMQSSGCIVQLRGKGCSQPSTHRSNEPVHLFVKYDEKEQFEKFKQILQEIVESYDKQIPKRIRPVGMKRRLPILTTNQSDSNALLQNIDVHHFTEQMLHAEVELIWNIRFLLLKETSVLLEELPELLSKQVSTEYISKHLQSCSIAPGPHQLLELVRSSPHCFSLTPNNSPEAIKNTTTPTSFTITLHNKLAHMSKLMLKKYHGDTRNKQRSVILPPTPYHFKGSTNTINDLSGTHENQLITKSTCNIERNSAFFLLLQGLHYILSNKEIDISYIQELFYNQFNIPLHPVSFGYPDIVTLLKAFPHIFSIQYSEYNCKISSVNDVDFNSLAKKNMLQDAVFPNDTVNMEPSEFIFIRDKTNTLTDSINQPPPPNTVNTVSQIVPEDNGYAPFINNSNSSLPIKEKISIIPNNISNDVTASHKQLLRNAKPEIKILSNPSQFECSAPRLLGLLGKLVKM